MPYIITTGTPWGRNLGARDKYAVTSRTAVATLDEARELVTDILSDDFQCPLSADGGTVGPLPDGTVIEVRLVSKPELGFIAGLLSADHPQFWSVEDLVAKHNRAGRFAGDPA